MAITRETIIERRQPQLRWSAVFGGALLAIAAWITLQVLGVGIGLASVDTENAGTLRGVGIGTGIWSLIAPLIAMFLGGLLAGRLAGTRQRKVGALHGTVVWALGLAVGLFMMMSIVGAIVGGAVRAGGAATTAAMRAGSAVDVGDAMSALGIDSQDLMAPINRRLEREGKPPITADQLEATVRAVAQRGLRQGRLDRAVLVDELAKHTNLSRTDAQEVADELGDRFQAVAERTGAAVEHTALQAADAAGKALTVGGLMMLLSAGAAIAGGALGVRRREDVDERGSRVVVTQPTGQVEATPPPAET